MKTALYSRHIDLGAKIVSFAEWEMPIQYKSILEEHQAVRQAAGLFDVSHMGRISVEGKEAENFLDYLSTNKVIDKQDGTAVYTVWCNAQGGCVDDVIIYRQDKEHFFVIVNAGNRQNDLQHLIEQAKNFDVTIQDHFEDEGILALQGPRAKEILSIFIPAVHQLKSMHFIQEKDVIISSTGYTGELGFELYGSQDQIVRWWDRLLEEGQKIGLLPVGLGARDTLRLEMGFALYGHELSRTIAPNESVSAWTIKWQKEKFLGKEALSALENAQPSKKRFSYGIILKDPGIAREGYSIWKEGKEIGIVTSGSFSPSLNKSIALILVESALKEGDEVIVKIRQKESRAQIAQLPFVRKKK